PLHPLDVELGVVGGHALAQAGGDHREAGRVQRLGDGGQLGDDVLARTALLEHPYDAVELAPSSLDPVRHRRQVLARELHRGVLSQSGSPWGCLTIPPAVFRVVAQTVSSQASTSAATSSGERSVLSMRRCGNCAMTSSAGDGTPVFIWIRSRSRTLPSDHVT